MLKHLFRLSFLFAALFPGYAQTQKSPVGVQLYSFRNQFAQDVRGTMQKVKDMGITYCETAGFYGMDAKAFRAILDEFGIKATGISADFGELEDAAKLKTVIENAKTLGAKTVTCFWIPHNGNEFTIEDVEKAVKVFNESGKTLAASGLMLLYHNHGYEFRSYKDRYLLDELITRTNPAHVSYQMDILWTQHPGHNPVAWLKKYPTRWKAMHIKDRKKGTPGNQFGQMDVENDVTLGQGDVNVADIIKQAQANKIQYFYIEDESSRSLEQVPQSIAFLRPLFGK
ncbi:MAG: sugar phosphate isomerase/epimerase [Cytophagales bacterium]|jgi:sugar phosphate isomerase/epimerase|nr:sugar phosphate isomerase/epimerase [Cytophagales bacterium]